MRVSSRELFVGFWLVLALGASGCQPVQPVTETSITATATTVSDSVGESATISETEVISESVSETGTTPATSDSAVSQTVTVSVTAVVTETSGISETVAMTESAASEPVADPALIAAGLTIYRAQYCGVCHTLDAAETHGTFGPPHNGMGAIAATRLTDGSYQGAATTPAEYIRESIVDPQAYAVPGYAATSHRMPVYAHLDSATLDALVAFLLAQ